MRKGFTLMEALMAIGLFSIILGLAVPSYLANNKTQRVVAMRDLLRQTYIQARDNANAGKKDCSTCGCANDGTDSPLQGWAVTYGPNTVNISGVCGPGAFPSGYWSFYNKTTSIPSNITVSVTNGGTTMMFRPGGKGVYPPLLPAQNFLVTITDGTNSRNFTITSAGNIQ